jgi:hypothetical protein
MSCQFIGRCTDLNAVDLGSYDDSSRSITVQTFRRHFGVKFRLLERDLGYRDWNLSLYKSGLSLRTDQAVRFTKGMWKGRPAICCHLSGIHHLWSLPL